MLEIGYMVAVYKDYLQKNYADVPSLWNRY